jgi:hypothetical protein
LLALLHTKDITILKDERLDECIKIFENYCNGGLSIIDSWLSENAQDFEGTSTLADRIFKELLESKEGQTGIDVLEPNF